VSVSTQLLFFMEKHVCLSLSYFLSFNNLVSGTAFNVCFLQRNKCILQSSILGNTLEEKTDVKLTYLQEAIVSLNLNDPSSTVHVVNSY